MLSEAVAHANDAELSINTPSASAAANAAATMGGSLPLGRFGDPKLMAKRTARYAAERERENEDSHVFSIEYKIVRRRKRDWFGGFSPRFEHRGPAFDPDRQYTNDFDDDIEAEKEAEDEGTLELEMDLPWNEALEDFDDRPETESEPI